MQYFFIENKTSDSQEEAKYYVFRQFFRTEKKFTIDRNINFHARTVGPRTASFFQIKDPIPRQLKSGIIYKHILMRVMIN